MSNLSYGNHFLNQIIYHSINDDDFLRKVRQIVPKEIFRTQERLKLIDILFNFFDEYGKAPKDNFIDLFSEYESSMNDALYDRCLKLVGILKDIKNTNRDYVLRTLSNGVRHLQLEEASVEFASLIKQGKYNEAKTLMNNALKEPEYDKPYYNFFEDKTFIQDRLKEERYAMQTKIDLLDKAIGGYRNSWLITVLAATKGGKTWFLIETAVQAVLQGKNVLFISLEMGKEQIDERFDMVIGFMTSEKSGKQIEVMKKIGDKWQTTLEDVDSVYDIDKCIKNRARLRKMSGGDLRIMAFNRGRVNYQHINNVLDELEESEGWGADVVVVDYLGIMKETFQGQNKKDRISENCIGLKEMAGNRDLVVMSAMQGNRQAMRAKVFHSWMVADDIDTIFNSDLILALCQTEVEEKENKARIYIANYRHGKQKASIGIVRDLTIGQVALDTFEITDDYTGNNPPAQEQAEPGSEY